MSRTSFAHTKKELSITWKVNEQRKPQTSLVLMQAPVMASCVNCQGIKLEEEDDGD
jgi:hypothetical protein